MLVKSIGNQSLAKHCKTAFKKSFKFSFIELHVLRCIIRHIFLISHFSGTVLLRYYHELHKGLFVLEAPVCYLLVH